MTQKELTSEIKIALIAWRKGKAHGPGLNEDAALYAWLDGGVLL